MRTRCLHALAALLAGSGLALAQPLPPQPVPVTGPSDFAAPPPVRTPVPPPPDLAPPPGVPQTFESSPPPPPEATAETDSRIWVDTEFLTWWIKGSRLPPLVTTGPAPATFDDLLGVPTPGALAAPGTQVLYGGKTEDNEARFGGRFALGVWFDDSQRIGLEGSYFFLSPRSINFTAQSSGNPGSMLLAQPVPGDPTSSIPIAVPELSWWGFGATPMDFSQAGTVHVSLSSEMEGAELMGVGNLARLGRCRVDFLGGFRFLQLNESLRIDADTSALTTSSGPDLFGPGTTSGTVQDDAVSTDQYDAHNDFYGGQIGLRTEFSRGPWFVDVLGKVALGVTHEVASENFDETIMRTVTAVDGQGNVSTAGPVGSSSSHEFFHITHNHFAVVPEARVNIGCDLTDSIRASMGYTFVYWSNVMRPGDQVEHQGSTTDFWTQGLNGSLEFRY